jgi:hypothetical protein
MAGCDLGELEFPYAPQHPLLSMLLGHGVAIATLNGERLGVIEGRGLRDGEGAIAAAVGTHIRHSRTLCQAGRLAANA